MFSWKYFSFPVSSCLLLFGSLSKPVTACKSEQLEDFEYCAFISQNNIITLLYYFQTPVHQQNLPKKMKKVAVQLSLLRALL